MRRQRIHVTMTYKAMVALELLAKRNDISAATQAGILLRQALRRTMDSPAVQNATPPPRWMTRAEWAEEQAAAALDLKTSKLEESDD